MSVKSRHGRTFSAEKEVPGELKEVAGYEFVDATDAILTLVSGEQFYVRLIASGITGAESTPKQTQYAEVLIDISDPVLRTASKEELRAHISLSPTQRRWCGNQLESSLRTTMERELQELAHEDDLKRDAILQSAPALPLEHDDPREKLRRLRAEFNRRYAHGSEANPQPAPLPPALPSWSGLAKAHTSFHAFRLRDDETCWVVINSAKHSGYYIVPAPTLFEGWDEALPSSLGVPDQNLGAYVGQGPMSNASTWFQHSGRLIALNMDSDPALTLKFTENQFPTTNDCQNISSNQE